MRTSKRGLDEVATLGNGLFESKVRSKLRPEDLGKFVAIDVESGDYELDNNDLQAVMRLRSRRPAAEVWLLQAGYPTTCRIGALV
jgi:hypothetical protein